MDFRGEFLYENTAFPYNLNIFGVRSVAKPPDYFSDEMHVLWLDGGKWRKRVWPITTVPGVPWLRNPMNPKGAAALVPGRYKATYSLGPYKGYTALKQVAPVRVYRDNNRDSVFDLNSATIEEGLFGIHIHRAGIASKFIGMSSAGCQVFKFKRHFDEFIDLCQKSAKHWGNHFTYTLIQE